MTRSLARQLLPGIAALSLFGTAAGQCDTDWLPGFGTLTVDDTCHAAVSFDAGSGPQLFVGGEFQFSGLNETDGLARWNGEKYASVVYMPNNSIVYDMLVHDSGTGPELYVGGYFSTAASTASWSIVKWDGTTWFSMDGGMTGNPGGGTPVVRALAVFDDGSGPAVYAAGTFASAGQTAAVNIARWDGVGWNALSTGTDGPVHSLFVHDDGSGPALYVGGSFSTAGGVAAENIARWDGSTWSAVGAGSTSVVRALHEFDDGSGLRLFAGGNFSSTAGADASFIGAWNGTSWDAVGAGLDGVVRAFHVMEGPLGPVLLTGGNFTSANPTPANYVAEWNGVVWRQSGGGADGPVHGFGEYDDGDGLRIVMLGEFEIADEVVASRVAEREPTTPWRGLTDSVGFNATVLTSLIWDDGTGEALYLGGYFWEAGGVPANRIVKWDGETWSALGTGVGPNPVTGSAYVESLCVWDDGTGEALYVGGHFSEAGGVPASNLARWDGESWSAVGGGVTISNGWQGVWALHTWDDGSGEALYVGGRFDTAGTLPASHVARWDGTTWSTLGAGVNLGYHLGVMDFVDWDDGTGSALYVGGSFYGMIGVPDTDGYARWDGTSFSAVGSGGIANVHTVEDLAIWDDGSGPALYVAGQFNSIASLPTRGIGRWDGTSWSDVGGGVTGSLSTSTSFTRVIGLKAVDDGTGAGEALFAVGSFTHAGGVESNGAARWNGDSWQPLGGGFDGWGYSIETFDDGSGPATFVGGSFEMAGGEISTYFAKWGRECPVSSYCEGAPNSAGPGSNLVVSGTTSVSANDFRLIAKDGPPGQFGTFFYGPEPSSLPFGDGVLCVTGGEIGTFRLNPPDQVNANGTTARFLDFTSAPASDGAGAVLPGTSWYFQFWYRDPFGPGGTGFNLSSGIAASFLP